MDDFTAILGRASPELLQTGEAPSGRETVTPDQPEDMSYGALVTIAVLCLTGQLAIADSNIKNGIITDNIDGTIKGANTQTGIIKGANTQTGITGKFIEDANINTGVTEDEWVGSVEELQESEEIVPSNANRRSGDIEPYDCKVDTPSLQLVAQMRSDATGKKEIAWDIKQLNIETGEYTPKWAITEAFGTADGIKKINAASIGPVYNKVIGPAP